MNPYARLFIYASFLPLACAIQFARGLLATPASDDQSGAVEGGYPTHGNVVFLDKAKRREVS